MYNDAQRSEPVVRRPLPPARESAARKVGEFFLKAIPTERRGVVEFYVRQALGKPYRSVFNGQEHRRLIFGEIVSACHPVAIAETGTFRGATTEFMAEYAGVPVHSAEINPEFYHYARTRLRRLDNVFLHLSNSVDMLKGKSVDPRFPKRRVLFYLDAHWKEYLPLRDELRLILDHWRDSVIMVDDFQVPDDFGYGYDDFGSDRALTLEYLAPLYDRDFDVFFPSVPSERETGRRRGCAVLSTSEPLRAKLMQVPSLRHFGSAASFSEPRSDQSWNARRAPGA